MVHSLLYALSLKGSVALIGWDVLERSDYDLIHYYHPSSPFPQLYKTASGNSAGKKKLIVMPYVRWAANPVEASQKAPDAKVPAIKELLLKYKKESGDDATQIGFEKYLQSKSETLAGVFRGKRPFLVFQFASADSRATLQSITVDVVDFKHVLSTAIDTPNPLDIKLPPKKGVMPPLGAFHAYKVTDWTIGLRFIADAKFSDQPEGDASWQCGVYVLNITFRFRTVDKHQDISTGPFMIDV